MRTTLTLDDAIANALKERARMLNMPFKQVVNDVLRRGLSPTIGRVERPRFRVRPFSGKFRPGIDQEKLNQLAGELEVEEFLRKAGE